MRMVWLMLCTLTPSCAAMSRRGCTTISGRGKSPLMRASRTSGNAAHFLAAPCARCAPPAADHRPSRTIECRGRRRSRKAQLPVRHLSQQRHHVLLPFLLADAALGAGHQADVDVAVADLAVDRRRRIRPRRSLRADFLMMAVAAADTREVSSSVPPGGSSMTRCALAKSSGGTNEVGMIVMHADRQHEEQRCRRRWFSSGSQRTSAAAAR